MGGGEAFVPNKPDESPLHIRLGVEAVCGTISAVSVAPAIAIVDRAIVANASGVQPLIPGIISGFKDLFLSPRHFFRQPSFIFICGVYSGTYIVGNSIEALCERSHTSSFFPKFLGSSFTNVTLSVLKDKAFARMFGKGTPHALPTMSYGLFAARDSLTIMAGFSLPAVISKSLQQSGWTKHTADTSSQLLLPVSMQIISTPFHLLGLDLYNREGITNADRINFIKQEYVKTTLARMARIFPAYGIGGVINSRLRNIGDNAIIELYSHDKSATSIPHYAV